MEDKVRTWVKTVYGPYIRKDGRKHVILWDGNRRQTVSYPKWLMEQHIGRELSSDETVDHKDRNITNDNFDNLRIISRSDHAKEDNTRVKKVEIVCVHCGSTALKSPKYLHHNAKQGKAGPFCSKKCSGRYGAEIQNMRQEKLPAQPEVPVLDREYYKPDKTGEL